MSEKMPSPESILEALKETAKSAFLAAREVVKRNAEAQKEGRVWEKEDSYWGVVEKAQNDLYRAGGNMGEIYKEVEAEDMRKVREQIDKMERK